MTKEVLIGQILLKVSGGNISVDNSVWYSDIQALIAPAVNYVQTKQYFIDGNSEGKEHLIQQFMLQVYGGNNEIAISTDAIRKRKYITLPKTPLSLPNGRALQFVGDVRGRGWIPLSQGADDMQEYYGKFKKDVTSYRPEGLKCYLWNVGPLVTHAMVKMLVNVNSLADTDEIILPSGGELEVINLIYEWISGTRLMPKDIIIDQKDKPVSQ